MANDNETMNSGNSGSILPGAIGALAGAGAGGWAAKVRHEKQALKTAPEFQPGKLHEALQEHIEATKKAVSPEGIEAHLTAKQNEFVNSRREAGVESRFASDPSLDRQNSEHVSRIEAQVDAHHAKEFKESVAHTDGVPHPQGKTYAQLAEEAHIEKHGKIAKAYEDALKLSHEEISIGEQPVGKWFSNMRDNVARQFRSDDFNKIHDEVRAEIGGIQDTTLAMKRAREAAWNSRIMTNFHADKIADPAHKAAFLEKAEKEIIKPLETIHLDAVARHVDQANKIGLVEKLELGAKEAARTAKGRYGMIAAGVGLGAAVAGGAAHLLLGRGSQSSHTARLQANDNTQGTPGMSA